MDVFLVPDETLQSRAFQWIHEQPANRELKRTELLSLAFPEGPHPTNNRQLDIMVIDEGMFNSFLQLYLTYAGLALEMVDGLGDPYDRKVHIVLGCHLLCSTFSFPPLALKDLNEHLNNLSPGPSPSYITNETQKYLGQIDVRST